MDEYVKIGDYEIFPRTIYGRTQLSVSIAHLSIRDRLNVFDYLERLKKDGFIYKYCSAGHVLEIEGKEVLDRFLVRCVRER